MSKEKEKLTYSRKDIVKDLLVLGDNIPLIALGDGGVYKIPFEEKHINGKTFLVSAIFNLSEEGFFDRLDVRIDEKGIQQDEEPLDGYHLEVTLVEENDTAYTYLKSSGEEDPDNIFLANDKFLLLARTKRNLNSADFSDNYIFTPSVTFSAMSSFKEGSLGSISDELFVITPAYEDNFYIDQQSNRQIITLNHPYFANSPFAELRNVFLQENS